MLNFLKPRHINIIDKIYGSSGEVNLERLHFFINYLMSDTTRLEKCFEYLKYRSIQEMERLNKIDVSMKIIKSIMQNLREYEIDLFLIEYLTYILNYMMYTKLYCEFASTFHYIFLEHNFRPYWTNKPLIRLCKVICHGLKNEFYTHFSENLSEDSGNLEIFPTFNLKVDNYLVLLLKSLVCSEIFFEERADFKMELILKSILFKETKLRHNVLLAIFNRIKAKHTHIFFIYYLRNLYIYKTYNYLSILKNFDVNFLLVLNVEIENILADENSPHFLIELGILFFLIKKQKIENINLFKSFFNVFWFYIDKKNDDHNFSLKSSYKKMYEVFNINQNKDLLNVKNKKLFSVKNCFEKYENYLNLSNNFHKFFDNLDYVGDDFCLFILFFRYFVKNSERKQFIFSNLLKKIFKKPVTKRCEIFSYFFLKETKFFTSDFNFIVTDKNFVFILKNYKNSPTICVEFIELFIEKNLLDVSLSRPDIRDGILAKLRIIYFETENSVIKDFLIKMSFSSLGGENSQSLENTNYNPSEDNNKYENMLSLDENFDISTYESSDNDEKRKSRIRLTDI